MTQFVPTLDALRSTLAETLPADNTIALVFLDQTFDAHDITAIKSANKWCDAVVCVGLSQKEVPKNLLEQAGCQFYCPFHEVESAVEVVASGQDSGYIMQAILAIMPDAVMVPIADIRLVKKLRAIDQTYKKLFTLSEIETPDAALTDEQISFREQLKTIGLNNALTGKTELLDVEHLTPQRQLRQKSFLIFEGQLKNRLWRDGFSVAP